jgi:glucosamine-6-phosphate deaminase
MEVLIRDSAETGCILGAKIIASVVREKPNAVLGLATGRTPLRLYQELIRLHRNEGLDFSKVTTFNLDEYVGLAPTHAQSYRFFMQDNLFRHINIDVSRTHVPNGVAPDLHAECRSYEARILEAGGIDIQLLGLGRNGHIGFNEPTGSLRSRTWIKILSEQTLKDNSEVFGSFDAMPKHAITMGIGTILDARRCLLLAFGPFQGSRRRTHDRRPARRDLPRLRPPAASALHGDSRRNVRRRSALRRPLPLDRPAQVRVAADALSPAAVFPPCPTPPRAAGSPAV